MAQNSKILTAIDVGTTKVCTIMGKRAGPGQLQILAHSIVPCKGLKRGAVADTTATARAVRASIDEVEAKTGSAVVSAYVGVTGSHVSFQNRSDTLEEIGAHGVITADELTRVPETVAAFSKEQGRRVIHARPMAYSLDGKHGISNPLGMHTRRLEVETHVVTGTSSLVDKLTNAVENAGVKVEQLVLEPLASSEAVLTPEERHSGAVLVDIGGGTTDVIVFNNRSIGYTAVIPVGGYQFTNDICVTYNTSYPAAERVKLEYAHTEPTVSRVREEVSLPMSGITNELKIPRRDICQLIRERAQELIRLIGLKLQDAQMEDISRLQLVLTGGTANLPGLESMMRRTLAPRVRIGIPNGHAGIPNGLKAPAYATGVGILLWALSQQNTTAQEVNSSGYGFLKNRPAPITRFLGQLRGLWPLEVFSAERGRL